MEFDFFNSKFQNAENEPNQIFHSILDNTIPNNIISNVDYKISTMTMSCKFPNCQLNLLNIGKYLEIDDEIIGIKYMHANLNVMKGQYSTTIYKKSKNKKIDKINQTLFYNQISIIIRVNNHDINVKLFGNGSLHMTGCKSKDDLLKVTQCIYKKLKMLEKQKTIILLSKDEQNILLDKDNLIYSYTDFQIIGHKESYKGNNKSIYNINKKQYYVDEHTHMFMSSKEEVQRKRTILNLDGAVIGYTQIELMKNHNKLYKKNSNLYYDWTNKLIFYNDSDVIGRMVYNIKNELVTDIKHEDILEIEYEIKPFIKEYNLDLTNLEAVLDINIHCINVCFSLNTKINRQKFYEKLVNLNYICKYRPESYSGIKFIYKTQNFNDINDLTGNEENDNLYENGKCYCTCKCICTNITFLIFQSGNIIVTGFKNIEQINNILKSFINIWNSFSQSVISYN